MHSKRLNVGIELPGEVYQGCRFDWSSQVVSLELDGRFQFASSEVPSDHPKFLTSGRGLSCEFGIRTPIGFGDTRIDQWFPKIGFGYLKRDSLGSYDFTYPYPDRINQNYSYTQSESELTIISSSSQSLESSFQWVLQRTWRVMDNFLVCESRLENHGTLSLVTDEYCHNFIMLDNQTLGREYEITFNFHENPKAQQVHDGSHCLHGAEPKLVKLPEADFYLGKLLNHPIDGGSWSINHTSSGLGMSETLVGTCIRCDLWGRSHVISPELFVQLSIAPGKSYTWTRTFEFRNQQDSQTRFRFR